jgi:capsular exopolysaccharide synthesis family protein
MIDPQTETQGPGLRHYLEVLRRRKWLVLAILAISLGAAAAVSTAQKPVYRANATIVIGQGNGLFAPNLSSAIQPFAATMSDLLKSNAVARRVIADLGLHESPEQLLSKISVSIKPESSAIRVSATDRDPRQARRVTQAVAGVFSSLVKRRFGKATPVGPGQAPLPPLTANVWDRAHVEPGKVSPRPVRNLVIAGVVGLALGLLAGFLRDHFDRALRTREAVEAAFGVPVIGQIPSPHRRGKALGNLLGESAEAYRALRANLQYLGLQRPLRTILLTSAAPEQGKTTVTANLALAIGRSGASTIAIEADLRRPRLAEAFGVEPSGPGLTSVLVGAASLEEAVRTLQVNADGDGTGARGEQLALLSSGPLPPNPSELLSSAQMRNLLTHLTALYDYILIDSPPVLAVADALELARTVDGAVMVARSNRATTDEAREVRALVERLDMHLLGTVITGGAPIAAYYGDYRAHHLPRRERAADREPVVAERR